MKRFFCLLLLFSLCIGMAACAAEPVEPPVPEDREDGGLGEILSLLDADDYEEAIEAIEKLQGGADDTETEGVDETQPSRDRVIEALPKTENGSWLFEMALDNPFSETVVLESLSVTDYLNGQESGSWLFSGADLASLPIPQPALAPGESTVWTDGHPIVADKQARDYRYTFRGESGETYTLTYRYELPAGSELPAAQPAGDFFFPILLENTTEMTLTLVAMDITDLMDGQPLGTAIFEGEEPLARIGLGGLVLQPGDTFAWNDAHPATNEWNGREYRFHFAQEAGGSWVHSMTFRFEDLAAENVPADYSDDQGQDLKTLCHGADFEEEVFEGVYWVPAAALGGSRYTNAEICAMLPAAPEEKQERISTLYEALQLYQIGNFAPSDDNIRSFENGINWEHHKPGYHAVRTNTGCCATDSNWLRYILDGDYDEVGFLATSQRDGSGHVYNYILQDGWYYFIDLTHYHAQGSPINTAEESGDLSHYHATDFILGNIHKTRSVENYVNYVQDAFNDPPGLMFLYTAENVLAVDSLRVGSETQIVYEEADGIPIEVVFDDPADQLTHGRAESPEHIPDWAAEASYVW